ncbi:transposase [Bradyrhizobium elkanii]|uniref:Transposase n=1 Tax=Bradyrhizobium elkanii TaxID=29448 RepID=A0ABV4FHJ0_BRAEL
MRRGFPSLALQVQEVLHKDPLPALLPGAGACLFTKRHRERKVLAIGCRAVTSPAQLSYLLGIDWRNPQETHRPTRVG